MWKSELLCLTFFRGGGTWAVGAWAAKSYLEINFWSCVVWDCWLRDNRCLWLEICSPEDYFSTSGCCKISTHIPCLQSDLYETSKPHVSKEDLCTDWVWKFGSALSCVFLNTKKVGISAEFLFLTLYYTVQVAPRTLEEDRKNIPKINIAANANTVFSELSYEPLSSVMHIFFS